MWMPGVGDRLSESVTQPSLNAALMKREVADGAGGILRGCRRPLTVIG